jgi:hypothetical protein
LPFPPPRGLVGVRPHDGSPWPAQHRAPPLSLARVPSSLSPVDALVMTLPQMPAKPNRNAAAHYRAMAAHEVLMWPRYSTPSRSSLVASLGPPRLQGADAPLCWPSSSRSSPAHHRAPSPSRRRHGRGS